ncbi:hypothetical protein SLW70_08285 [Flavobacterium sp. NG2]|uniref:hypothetical protein n=1 Tax=Flavobacterium sp. NG2 TaxID=3097547 RepID=UPI002A837ADF|nr:hypothetical protein [Flavobacterium sp. NG2]WPR73103.1 hypothetical protein SLW70_08285 [Flavobacterium sp. NG2]
MKIDLIDKKTLKHFPSSTSCDINCLHIKIKDFKPIVKEFETYITDSSWINSLDEISKKVFKVNAEKTIDKIVNEIIAGITTSLNEDIGEFIVSYSAQLALEIEHLHQRIPLAELLKEKITGNPGFDFHTISTNNYLVFGEAKFSLDSTPRAKALEQIEKFIGDRDNAELKWLEPFLDSTTKANIIKDEKGYTAAFSFNGENILTILNNALLSAPIAEIIKHKELYLIAVELC